jgi:hypothetical protein
MYGRTEEVTREMMVIGAALIALLLVMIGSLV